MFNSNFCPIMDIVKLYSFSEKNVVKKVGSSHLYSLSIRFDSDTKIVTDREEHHLTTGDICFLPGTIPFKRISKKDNVIVLGLKISNCTYNDLLVYKPKNPEKYYTLFNELLEKWTKKDYGFKADCLSILYRIVYMIQNDVHKKELNSLPEALSNSIAKINSDFGNPGLTVESLAKENFISEVYLRSLFSKHLNTTPKKYLNDLRLKYAYSMIESTTYSIKEIAVNCGFSECSYFSYAFKKAYGKSPSSLLEEKIKQREI